MVLGLHVPASQELGGYPNPLSLLQGNRQTSLWLSRVQADAHLSRLLGQLPPPPLACFSVGMVGHAAKRLPLMAACLPGHTALSHPLPGY